MTTQNKEVGGVLPYDGELHYAVRASCSAFDRYLAERRFGGVEPSGHSKTVPYLARSHRASGQVDFAANESFPPQHAARLREVIEALRQLEQSLREEAIEQLQSCIGGNLEQ